MAYQFEIQGEKFGNMTFPTPEAAALCLKQIIELAASRHQIATRVNQSAAKSLREVQTRIIKQLKIVKIEGEKVEQQMETKTSLRENGVVYPRPPQGFSTIWRKYSEVPDLE